MMLSLYVHLQIINVGITPIKCSLPKNIELNIRTTGYILHTTVYLAHLLDFKICKHIFFQQLRTSYLTVVFVACTCSILSGLLKY